MSTYFKKYEHLTQERLEYTQASVTPKTDLHTHLAGVLSGEQLLNIGIKHHISYPQKLLNLMGIETNSELPLSDLSETDKKVFVRSLSTPINKQIRFTDEVNCLENIYAYRQVFQKNPDLVKDIMEEICKTYRAMGVSYVELSSSAVFDVDSEPQIFKKIVEALPDLEKKYNIDVRFLAAMNRQDDKEWSWDNLEKLKKFSHNKYIAGIDIVGHENNSTKEFAANLEPYMEYSVKNNLNWVFRFHAGENPSFPNNVREAVKMAAKYNVSMRVGHGLYGVDEETITLLKAHNVVIEVNPTSNLSLNNITNLNQMSSTISYIKNGISVVVGTDSPGIYQTTTQDECAVFEHLLKQHGENKYLQQMLLLEKNIISRRKMHETNLASHSQEIPDVKSFQNIHRHYSKKVEIHKRQRHVQVKNEKMHKIIQQKSLYLEKEEINQYFSHKKPFVIAGASKVGWSTLKPQEKNKIKDFINDLLNTLDPEEYYLITGGSNYGVEDYLHKQNEKRQFDVVGVLTSESDVSEHTVGITHYTLLNQNLWGKFPYIMENILKPQNGKIIFIAGGAIVNDEILSAMYHKMDKNSLFLMAGVGGASSQKAEQNPLYAISDINELQSKIHSDILVSKVYTGKL